MGQANLVRLEKINCSMFWEGGALLNNEYWATTKYMILFKYIHNVIFFTKKTFWKFLWKASKNIYSTYATSMKAVEPHVQYKTNYFLPMTYNKNFKINKVVLAFYIYQVHNKNYIFFLISQPKLTNLYSSSIKVKKKVSAYYTYL